MRRRAFITLLGGAAAWPVVARAQQSEATPRIGVLMTLADTDSEGQLRVAAFRQELQKLGWIEGRNIRFEYRWAAGDAQRLRAHAQELVGMAPEVMLAGNNAALRALQEVTRTVPIVFAQVADPVGSGFVASLARPGGNITGFALYEPAIAVKWLELLIADIAYQNKAVIYDLLFKASSETTLTIAADPKHLGARIGILSVLHTWGSALTHHPHAHMIVPGGGFSLDGKSWVVCRPSFFLPVRVLSRLFRRLFLQKLAAAHAAGELRFFGNHAPLTDAKAFAAYLAPLRNSEWVVYSKRPFGGPEQVLRYLARYTHRVAISNRRLIACDDSGVTFKWKDYRIEGPERYKVMTLATHEFIRRFLIHVLPAGFHRIRYYGLLASGKRAENIARARELLALPLLPIDAIKAASNANEPQTPKHPCPCCGGTMIIIEIFQRGCSPRYRPTSPAPAIRIDTS